MENHGHHHRCPSTEAVAFPSEVIPDSRDHGWEERVEPPNLLHEGVSAFACSEPLAGFGMHMKGMRGEHQEDRDGHFWPQYV